MLRLRYIVLALVALLASCSEETPVRRRVATKEAFVRHNRNLFWCDSLCIVRYSDSLGLVARPTESNLWLTIHRQGTGDEITNGTKLSYAYTVSTLLGDTIYSSDSEGIKTVTIGQREAVAGLEEAMLKMRRGAEATVILIPEKAYGVRGDGTKIHGRTILRYDINILDE